MTEPAAPVALDLLRRYDRPGPRYTSYPTAVEFGADFDETAYGEALDLAARRPDEPLSLYVHLPFCAERCHYCGCNVVITRRRDVAVRYLDYLERELRMLARRLGDRRRLAQLHWGGGTPTYLDAGQMRRLHGVIAELFALDGDAEVAVEVDPRVTGAAHLQALSELGFNRLSFGVQDLDPAVQAAIGRGQTEAQTRRVHAQAREGGFASINFDLVYGLPRQEPKSFRRTIEQVIGMRPDRLALYSYAHVPWLRAHQKRIREEQLPTADGKLQLFWLARELLLGAGYRAIGMDHFALPDDELVQASDQRRLQRNFMGYTVRKGADLVGVGVSAIGEVSDCFSQNEKKLSTYYAALDQGRFPVERGYRLDRDDRIRRDVIQNLMCNFRVSMVGIQRRHDIAFEEYFADELAELRAADGPVAHGFAKIDEGKIDVVGVGRLFVRNLAMIFDRHLRESREHGSVFSRTV